MLKPLFRRLVSAWAVLFWMEKDSFPAWYRLPCNDEFRKDLHYLQSRSVGLSSWMDTIFTAVACLKYLVGEMERGGALYMRQGDGFYRIRVRSYDHLVDSRRNADEVVAGGDGESGGTVCH